MLKKKVYGFKSRQYEMGRKNLKYGRKISFIILLTYTSQWSFIPSSINDRKIKARIQNVCEIA